MTKHFLVVWLTLAALLSLPARADDGHNHDAAPSAPTGPALPRFAAVSDLFELVGIVDGKRLTVYLDRFADNQPVPGATVELDLGSTPVALQEHAPGEFEGTLADALAPGVTPVTATIVAGTESDLLAGEIDVHETAHAEPTGTALRWWPWMAAAALLALAGTVWARRRSTARSTIRMGGAA